MKATILENPPISGTYSERYFHVRNQPDHNIYVLFELEDSEWLGIFERGDFGCTAIEIFRNRNSCFIIADGEGYVINTESGDLLYKPESSSIKKTLKIDELDILLAWSDGAMLVLSGKKQLCESIWDDIDGIELINYDDDRIHFILRDIGRDFECCVDLNTNTMTHNQSK